MTFMEWEERYRLGVARMDQEHQGLIEAMNVVHELDGNGAAKATIDAAIARLAQLTTRHFADEEAHMEAVGFPDLSTHRIIHKNLLEKFTKLYGAFQQGDGRVDRAFFDFLKFWLQSHIMGIDRKYAEHGKPAKV